MREILLFYLFCKMHIYIYMAMPGTFSGCFIHLRFILAGGTMLAKVTAHQSVAQGIGL